MDIHTQPTLRTLNWSPILRLPTMLVLASVLLSAAMAPSEATIPIIASSLTRPFPAFENLSFEWAFSGDDKKVASVAIQCRPVGETTWKQGTPLCGVDAGSNGTISGGAPWTTKYSGSLFKLMPGTNYEVQLNMNDPNGGSSQQTLNVGTRALSNMMQDNIIEFDPGSHSVLNVQSGTPGNPNVYRSKSFSDPAQFFLVNLEEKHDVHIIGLDIDNPTSWGILAYGDSDHGF